MTLQEQIEVVMENIDTPIANSGSLQIARQIIRKQSEMLKVAKEALDAAVEFCDWFMENSRQADHAHSELEEKLEETKGWKELIDGGYNGLIASYDSQFKQALATIEELEKL